MKHHDFKTDATPIYHDFEDGRFFINTSSCIISANQIVQTGKIYLCSNMQESETKLMLVKLLNVRFDGGLVHMQLMDILTSRVFEVRQVVRPKSEECTWMLIDMDFFNKQLHKNKADLAKEDDTLLEFEF
jgi:hypothetical protein